MFGHLAQAQDNDEGFTYSPEGCDFAVTFPAEPGTGRRCPSDPDEPCQEVARYTKIYNPKSSVKAEISCRLISDDLRQTYNENVMEQIVRDLAGEIDTEDAGLFYRENVDDKVRITALTGMRQAGYNNSIYTAQIWVGPGSVMIFEGELAGGKNKQADDLFAQILSSLQIKARNDSGGTGDQADEAEPATDE